MQYTSSWIVYYATLHCALMHPIRCASQPASVLDRLRHIDCFWQFTKYKVSLSSDNIIMCAYPTHQKEKPSNPFPYLHRQSTPLNFSTCWLPITSFQKLNMQAQRSNIMHVQWFTSYFCKLWIHKPYHNEAAALLIYAISTVIWLSKLVN